MKMNKIKKEDIIGEVIKKYPDSIEVFLEFNLHCVGCPMVSQETIEGGCRAHGIEKEKIEKLIEKLNKKIKGETNEKNSDGNSS